MAEEREERLPSLDPATAPGLHAGERSSEVEDDERDPAAREGTDAPAEAEGGPAGGGGPVSGLRVRDDAARDEPR